MRVGGDSGLLRLPLSRVALIALLASSTAWLDAGEMKSERDQLTATLLPDGRVLLAGGNSGPQMQETNAELYDPITNEWIAAAPMKERRQSHAAVLLDGDPGGSRVLITGGANSQVTLRNAEIYDSAQDQWKLVTVEMSTPRRGHTSTRLPDGKVLVTGGWDTAVGTAGFVSVELYDPGANAWLPAAPLKHARWGHTATLLQDGTVLVVGGQDGDDVDLASAELYDPLQGDWSDVGSMKVLRREHTATLLHDGSVLVAGGARGRTANGNYSAHASSETYDPVKRTWTSAGSMHAGRELHGAALLPDGKALVAGGQSLQGVSSGAELFDPATRAWAYAEPLTHRRYTFAMTLLTSGRVLAAGGFDYQSNVYPQMAELYDPTCAGACTGPKSCDHAGNAAKECSPRSCSADRTRSLAPALCRADSMLCAPDEERVITPCAPYRCDDASGACLDRCVSVDDCAPDRACDLSGRCVARPALAYDTGHRCSLSRTDDSGSGLGPFALLLAGAALASRRARRLR